MLLRVDASTDAFASGLTPTFLPGPVTVNFVQVDSAKSITLSISVPPGTPPGVQSLHIDSNGAGYDIPSAIAVTDAALPNPTPATLAAGQTAQIVFAASALFDSDTLSLDLGPDVTATDLQRDPTGAIVATVSVSPTATPGVRSVHLAVGAHAFAAQRGFAVDPGPLRNAVHLSIPGRAGLDLMLPDGYTASVFAVQTAQNGLVSPDESIVDSNDILYVLNEGSSGASFSMSAFDLKSPNPGTVNALYTSMDPSGQAGLLESAAILPDNPTTIIYSTEDYDEESFLGLYEGGRTIQRLDTTTGLASAWGYFPDLNLDPIDVGLNGHLTATFASASGAGLRVFDANLEPMSVCYTGYFSDILRADPLSANMIVNGSSKDLAGAFTFSGLSAVDSVTCSISLIGDGPLIDEGRFGRSYGSFGNGLYAASTDGLSVYTWLSAAAPDLPWHAVKFASGFGQADSVAFDRASNRMFVVDRAMSAVIEIRRIPGYSVQAQGEISGIVVDAASGRPIPNAVVSNNGVVASTDAAGVYSMSTIPAGDVQLAVRRPGYLAAIANSSVLQNQVSVNDLSMRKAPAFDFDGDGKSDIGLWRPSEGRWYTIKSSNGATLARGWGDQLHSDVPVAADYDGDGKTDIAIWRPASGLWYVVRSSDGGWSARGWGDQAHGDQPVQGDYDGDGKTDLAIWRPASGLWYVLKSSDGGWTARGWGDSGHSDHPVPGDYDGDGKNDLAIWRPATGLWYVLRSSDGAWSARAWGDAGHGDVPVPGDYDGDGRTDLAVWRPSTATWYVLRSSDGQWTSRNWGDANDTPVPGDYDGDGKTDVAVWRGSTGYWYIIRSLDGAIISQRWGSTQLGDLPNQRAL